MQKVLTAEQMREVDRLTTEKYGIPSLLLMGKQVTALVELKARFDEENNIEWARRLENEGVHVVYGISTLKTHSKVLLVVRREKERLCRYVHLATGNYNPVTSRIYTDLGILTADEDIGEDATSLFNFLTGYSQQDKYKRLIVAPLNLRERLIAMARPKPLSGPTSCFTACSFSLNAVSCWPRWS